MAKVLEVGTKLPEGLYWVGDLCYVMHNEWDEFCKDIFTDDMYKLPKNLVIELNDGRKIAMVGTAFGDGVYTDQYGNEYPVDAGLIGAILDIDRIQHKDDWFKGGHLHQLNEFYPDYKRDGGIIQLDTISIETDAREDEEEDEYEEDEYEEDEE